VGRVMYICRMGKKGTYSTSDEPVSNPFAEALKGVVAEHQMTERPETPVDTQVNSKNWIEGSTLVVRKERKGRGGKTATILSGLEGEPAQMKKLGKELGRSLGCGVFVEGADLVIQGDHRVRLKKLLEDRGARRVKMSGG
jgi:translation initiation factor 1